MEEKVPFIEEFNYQKRKEMSDELLERFSGKIPIICEKAGKAKNLPDLDRNK
jgi:hypothetical protein